MPAEKFAHIQLDPIGGIAGDMAVAALLGLAPGLAPELTADLRRSGVPAEIEIALVPGDSGGIRGHRFIVRSDATAVPGGHYTALDALIAAAPLPPPTRQRARSILRRLAEAEAQVHGEPLEHVHFHELAGWDSMVDVLAAAWLIERWGNASWSVGPLPVGHGRVRTAHGFLPVPAPATAILLHGFAMLDDGIGGERVTPTGAAILAELRPGTGLGPAPLRLAATGHGLGTRVLPGLPNMLRASAYLAQIETAATADEVAVLRFEIDDQTAEELALGLERVRAVEGVLDVAQWPVVGKRGRLGTSIQVLARPTALDAAADACLSETTTLGVRVELVQRRMLARDTLTIGTAAGAVRAKRVLRPDGGATAKAELRDLERVPGGQATRSSVRRRVETAAIEDKPE